MKKRVFLIVLDSFGAGEMPDAASFGDAGANTLRSVSGSSKFKPDNLRRLGLFNIDGAGYLKDELSPSGAYGRIAELSKGKDTTTGHWEIAGIISESPMPTFPDGFPGEVIKEFEKQTGRGVLVNKPYSGTQVIKDYGEEHLKTGKLIVYTSADSVFQIAANESIVPVETLYEYCRIARKILTGKYGVGRVIARPFTGDCADNFERTAKRHDFSLEPPQDTMLDLISRAGLDTIAVGKIYDIFAGKGITEHLFTSGNTDGMEKTLSVMSRDFSGLCFVNLVDFDMLYGHRRDIDGYAAALTEFDIWLGRALPLLHDDDIMIITADHGCDPAFTKTTDHTREYIPLLVCGKNIRAVNLGTLSGFCDIGKSVCDYLEIENTLPGKSFIENVM
ncbi:MAG: phosphopentomutase [Clostridia bacterium]|jgi:phosphopentomutase|nr:phosphopentomutase [Clostridia bacterium]